MPRIRVCSAGELPPGRMVRVESEPPIAVYNVGGALYATDDTCTHAEASLADGYLEGDEVECPFHAARFCVRTGAVRSLPASKPLRTYAVVVDGDEVFVEA